MNNYTYIRYLGIITYRILKVVLTLLYLCENGAVCWYYLYDDYIIDCLIQRSSQYNNNNNLFVALLIADDWSQIGFRVRVSKR